MSASPRGVGDVERAIAAAPEDAALYRELGRAHRAAGATAEAMAAELAATALDSRSSLALYNLATAYFSAGQHEPAARWYRLALRIDPDLALAHQNLAAILEEAGRTAEARHHRDLALRRQNIFIETAPAEKRRVLILAAGGFGNVPIDFLLPRDSTMRIKWFVDYATDDQAEALPPYDLVFNAMGDADMAGPLSDEAARFLRVCAKPILNAPAAVARTRRDRLPALLTGIEGVVVPPVRRLEGASARDIAATIEESGIGLPVLLRPVGSHGGKDVRLLVTKEELSTLDVPPDQIFYVTKFRDYRSADGYFRKYRVIFVDREPYPYHLAISEHWLVHYFTADMLAAPWKRAEEQRFLDDPAAVLGSRAMTALAAIARRIDLDFAGIDFALLPGGDILVFEANATMLVHLRDSPTDFPYKHVHVPRIFAAFDAMLKRRSGA